ncbi:putative damage-inducible protein DinB [Hamadaea flava]|uniref:DinB family protein n=1 Tax=Hamadaea flava TaxID=1742688 RepID=A0ABV8LLX9_9ACTN|nr:DinB family protein [Hamadaea flava]MCP2321500.1 putative damage-inducible protein DinB [Hamadaea flava]
MNPDRAIPDDMYQLGERELLTTMLDNHRATLMWKCAGLTDDQLRLRAVEPATLSLIGLVRHLTGVEEGWLAEWDGREPTVIYEGYDASFNDVDSADVAAGLAAWRAKVDESRRIVAARTLADVLRYSDGSEVTMRYVLAHLIEEYARHNGHADLLRQRIDGATGE